MDAIEQAIRNAFKRGNAGDRTYREKVYRSAFAALDRALESNPGVTQEVVERRRQALSQQISRIEREFLSAAPAVEPAVGQPQRPAPPRQPPQAPVAPQPGAQASRRIEPSFEVSPIALDDGYESQAVRGDAIEAPTYADGNVRPRRRRTWARAFAAITLVCFLAIGGWWAYDLGLFQSPEERDGSVPNPPQAREEEDFVPEEQTVLPGARNLEDWILVFDPKDPTTVTAPGDSRAEVLDDEGELLMRISSGESGSPVLFDVGQGVLEQVAGRRAVFSIDARAQDGGTQISVECSLGELGDCGRKRYAVGTTREEFLFEIEFPDANPGAGGTIAIDPDIDDNGRSVDIYAIRVSPAE